MLVDFSEVRSFRLSKHSLILLKECLWLFSENGSINRGLCYLFILRVSNTNTKASRLQTLAIGSVRTNGPVWSELAHASLGKGLLVLWDTSLCLFFITLLMHTMALDGVITLVYMVSCTFKGGVSWFMSKTTTATRMPEFWKCLLDFSGIFDLWALHLLRFRVILQCLDILELLICYSRVVLHWSWGSWWLVLFGWSLPIAKNLTMYWLCSILIMYVALHTSGVFNWRFLLDLLLNEGVEFLDNNIVS